MDWKAFQFTLSSSFKQAAPEFTRNRHFFSCGITGFGYGYMLVPHKHNADLVTIESPRQKFIQLGHIDTLLEMLSMNDDISIQLATLQILTALIHNGWVVYFAISLYVYWLVASIGTFYSTEMCIDIGHKLSIVLPACSHLVKKGIFKFLYHCIISPNGIVLSCYETILYLYIYRVCTGSFMQGNFWLCLQAVLRPLDILRDYRCSFWVYLHTLCIRWILFYFA